MTTSQAYHRLLSMFRSRDERQLDDALRNVLATEDGRRILRWICSETGVYGYIGRDREGMAYRAGMHDAGCRVLERCNAVAPDMVRLSVAERNAEMADRNERLRNAADEGNGE